jgi:hypothetical protein
MESIVSRHIMSVIRFVIFPSVFSRTSGTCLNRFR